MLCQTDETIEDCPWPDVNPITGKPLWDTQPFWRNDGSFDLYGYLKQFTPEYKGLFETIGTEECYYDVFKKYTVMYGSGLGVFHHYDIDKIPYSEIRHSMPLSIDVRLSNSIQFNRNHKDIADAVHFHGAFRMADGTWSECEASAQIVPGYEGRKIRITGSDDAYINETLLKSLEMILHAYVDDHTFQNVVGDSDTEVYVSILDHDQDKARIWFSKSWHIEPFYIVDY